MLSCCQLYGLGIPLIARFSLDSKTFFGWLGLKWWWDGWPSIFHNLVNSESCCHSTTGMVWAFHWQMARLSLGNKSFFGWLGLKWWWVGQLLSIVWVYCLVVEFSVWSSCLDLASLKCFKRLLSLGDEGRASSCNRHSTSHVSTSWRLEMCCFWSNDKIKCLDWNYIHNQQPFPTAVQNRSSPWKYSPFSPLLPKPSSKYSSTTNPPNSTATCRLLGMWQLSFHSSSQNTHIQKPFQFTWLRKRRP